jgi:hypothetical protein
MQSAAAAADGDGVDCYPLLLTIRRSQD